MAESKGGERVKWQDEGSPRLRRGYYKGMPGAMSFADELPQEHTLMMLARQRSVTGAEMDTYVKEYASSRSPSLARANEAAQHASRAPIHMRPRRSFLGLPLIPYDHLFIRIWNAALLLLDTTYTAIWLPILFAFSVQSDITEFIGAIDLVVGLILIFDILLQFHTCIVVHSGMRTLLIDEPRVVARFYVRGTGYVGAFFLDLLAAVPLVILPFVNAGGSVFVFVYLFRLLRLARVRRVLKAMGNAPAMSLTATSTTRLVLGSVLSSVYTIFVMVNFLACFWYWIGDLKDPGTNGWLNQDYKFMGEVDQQQCDARILSLQASGRDEEAQQVNCDVLAFAEGDFDKWLASFYFVLVTLTTVGYGDITPASTIELFAAMVIMLGGLALFAIMLGTLQELLTTTSTRARRSSALRSKMTSVQAWMDQRGLSMHMRARVARFYSREWVEEADASEEAILNELPHVVRAEVVWDMVKGTLRRLPLWQGLEPAQQKVLAERLQPVHAFRGQDVARQGKAADSIYFLQRGTVAVLNLTKVVGYIRGPCTFGEAALVQDELEVCKTRLSGYRAIESCQLWALDVSDVFELEAVIPRLRENIYEALQQQVWRSLEATRKDVKELIDIFLKSLVPGTTVSQADRDRMFEDVAAVVDTNILQILTFLDKHGRQQAAAGTAGMSMASSRATTVRRGAFVPHDEEPETRAASPSGTPPHSVSPGQQSAASGPLSASDRPTLTSSVLDKLQGAADDGDGERPSAGAQLRAVFQAKLEQVKENLAEESVSVEDDDSSELSSFLPLKAQSSHTARSQSSSPDRSVQRTSTSKHSFGKDPSLSYWPVVLDKPTSPDTCATFSSGFDFRATASGQLNGTAAGAGPSASAADNSPPNWPTPVAVVRSEAAAKDGAQGVAAGPQRASAGAEGAATDVAGTAAGGEGAAAAPPGGEPVEPPPADAETAAQMRPPLTAEGTSSAAIGAEASSPLRSAWRQLSMGMQRSGPTPAAHSSSQPLGIGAQLLQASIMTHVEHAREAGAEPDADSNPRVPIQPSGANRWQTTWKRLEKKK